MEEFEIQDQTSHHKFFDVYSARSRKNLKMVLLKIYPLSNATSKRMFRQESCNLKKVKEGLPLSPSLVYMIKSFEELRPRYVGVVVLEDPGYSLEMALTQGALSLQEKIFIFADVCRAVEACHDIHIAHMSVQPENIFLSDGVTKLGGFHASFRWNSYHSTTSCIFGEPPYRAPEMGKSHSYAPFLVPQWCLGILLHYMITDGIYPEFTYDQNETLPVNVEDSLPEDMKSLICSLLEINPRMRPPVTSVIAEDVLEFYELEHTSPTQTPLSSQKSSNAVRQVITITAGRATKLMRGNAAPRRRSTPSAEDPKYLKEP